MLGFAVNARPLAAVNVGVVVHPDLASSPPAAGAMDRAGIVVFGVVLDVAAAGAALAILAAVRADDPPPHLLLRTDALCRAREKLDDVTNEIDWREDVTRSTNYPETARS